MTENLDEIAPPSEGLSYAQIREQACVLLGFDPVDTVSLTLLHDRPVAVSADFIEPILGGTDGE